MHNGLVDTPLSTHKEQSVFSGTSQCLVSGGPLRPQPFTGYINREPVAFTVILFSSSLTQSTNQSTLPTQQHFKSRSFEAHSAKSVDAQQTLQTGKLVCINHLGAAKNMSGNAGAGRQPCLNAGASPSVNSSVTSTNSPTLQGLSQNISLGSAGPISLVLSTPSTPSHVSSNTNSPAQTGLTVPATPQTPVLSGMTKTAPVPHLSLDQESSTSSNTSLVTASPYTVNETTTFPKGTSLWQSLSSNASTTPTSTPSSIITASPYTTNESVTFAKGTSLWQPSTPPQTPSKTPTQTPTQTSTSLVTLSPYATNETTTFPTGTSLWQSSSSNASTPQTPTQSSTSLITSSPYAQNESVTFPAGTALWQSSNTTTAVSASSTPTAPACNVASSAPSSIRPMSAPLPATNIISASPYAQNESVTFSSQTSLWSSTNTSTSTTSSSGETSLITSSPYTNNEAVTFPPGTPM